MKADKFVSGLGRDYFIHPDQVDAKGGAEKFIPGLGLQFLFEEKHISEKGGAEKYMHGLGRDYFVYPHHVVGFERILLAMAISEIEFVTISADGADIEESTMWTTEAVKTALEEAVTVAQGVLDTESTPDEVEVAIETLETAIETYVKAQKPGTKA